MATELRLPRAWPLLFPATFVAHIAEECYGGFPAWAARWLGFALTPATFLDLNVAAWVCMFVASIAATLGPRWLVVPFATATFVNGCAHVVMTIATRSYSPGVVTGTLSSRPPRHAHDRPCTGVELRLRLESDVVFTVET